MKKPVFNFTHVNGDPRPDHIEAKTAVTILLPLLQEIRQRTAKKQQNNFREGVPSANG